MRLRGIEIGRGLSETMEAAAQGRTQDEMFGVGLVARECFIDEGERALGIDRVRLLTNNPAKVAGLEREGILVTARIAHHMPTNPHNANYLATKKSRSGHLA